MAGLTISDSRNGKDQTTNSSSTHATLQNGVQKSRGSARKKDEPPVIAVPIDPKTLLFFEAIREGSLPKVKSILRGKNFSLNTRDLNNKNAPTALIVACEMDNPDIVKLLLTAKKARFIDVNQEDKCGRRPIWYIIQFITFIYKIVGK